MAAYSRSIDEYVAAKWLGLAGSAAGLIGLIPLWDTKYRYWVIAVAVVFAVILIWSQLVRDRLSVFSSGLVSFIPNFVVDRNNADVFASLGETYDYLGCSFSTVFHSFENWFRKNKRGSGTLRILLPDPLWPDGLAFQCQFEDCAEGEKHGLAAAKQDRINSSVTALARLAVHGNIEVRWHRERLHEWMHCVDGKIIYLGLLRAGKSNLECPVAILEEGRGEMFDHYWNYFKLLWDANEERKVDLSKYR